MDSWEVIVNSDTEHAYVDNCNRFKIVSDKFPKFLECVETLILGSMKEKFVKFLGQSSHAHVECNNKQS